MSFLLDTHAFLWAVGGDRRLSAAVRAVLADGNNDVCFSIVSAWEIAIKVVRGKIGLDVELRDLVIGAAGALAVRSLPVSLAHVCEVAELPLRHRDPFDRMLVAQARVEGLTLLTCDAEVAAYDVATLW